MIIVLGAGIAGISAAFHLKNNSHEVVVYEKNKRWGGLCGSFEIGGFRFDHAIHLSFTKDEYVKNVFSESSDFISHNPEPINYFKGVWIKHPAQNNLFPLPVDLKVKIIKEVVKNKNKKIVNYEDWLKVQYGETFSETFPMEYTKKYWCCEASELSVSWVGGRMYQPDLEEVLRGALTEDTPNTYYAPEMRYPVSGGYQSFLKNMTNDLDIKCCHKVSDICVATKAIEFSNGVKVNFDYLISSIPLPEYSSLIKDMPDNVVRACSRLRATSVALVSIGLRKTKNNIRDPKKIWFYIYDEEFLASRCYSPSMKSSDNAPEGCESFQFEIYFTKDMPLPFTGDEMIQHIIKESVRIGLFEERNILISDYRELNYGNVVFYSGMEADRAIVKEYLERVGIRVVGRFGEWEYFWSDQSMLSGKRVADQLSDVTL